MRAKSLTWARSIVPTLLVGLFALASVTATAQAQPRRGQPMGPDAMGRRGVPPNIPGLRGPRARVGMKQIPRVTRPRFSGRAAPALNRAGRADVRRTPRRAIRPGQPRGNARRPGLDGRPRTVPPKVGLAPNPNPLAKANRASQSEARRLARLRTANKDTQLMGAVSRKSKDKGRLVNQLLFYILFSLIICFSLVTITRKSPLMAALSLLVVFLGLAGVYLFLQAPFMAAIQLIVYAGAVIVLFVFVIMSIGFDEERSVQDLGKEILYFAMAFMLTGAGAFVFHAGSGLGYVAGFAAMELMALAFIIMGKLQYPVTRFLGIAAVTFALAQVVRLVQMSQVLIGSTVGLKLQPNAPKQLYAASADGSFGNAKAIGQSVFTDNVFAFEALSLLLLASIVAAVVIVRSRKETKEQTS